MKSFIEAAAALGVPVIEDEPLSRHTTFRIGGPADLYAAATTTAQLVALADLAAKHDVPITILGGGSNVLVSDAGVRGLVIAVQSREVALRRGIPGPDGEHGDEGELFIVADAGVPLAGLARWAIKNGWAGLEWAVSVPGTVGGAVVGNAGAHGGDMAGNVAWVQVWLSGQGRQVWPATEMGFSYRSSRLKAHQAAGEARTAAPGEDKNRPHPVVLTVGLHAVPGNVAEMEARAERYLAQRRATQPVEPSAGSIFRNPAGDYAGRLVEAAGLKGYRHGGTQISPRHANFIINTGQATAGDVVVLVNLMRRRVYESTGIVLMPEILFLGEWADPPLSDL
ncbi:MAG: UDP-N-acetylmuramate dehydrogenase [Anaerolineae bacterium]|nr:UDP-N-acetylmuramate dehydrogenase [Anaerolineae bacterium]